MNKQRYLLNLLVFPVFIILSYYAYNVYGNIGFLTMIILAIVFLFSLGIFSLREVKELSLKTLWEKEFPVEQAYMLLFLILVFFGAIKVQYWWQWLLAAVVISIASIITALVTAKLLKK